MKNRQRFQKFVLITIVVLLVASLLAPVIFSQAPEIKAPREEKLLNGLKVLMWNDAAAEKVRISLRIHAGTSFDPQRKEGVMKLLAANIFPTPDAREFFVNELDGSLDVTSNYDYIQIDASSRRSDFLTMLETVAQAVSNIQIDKETTDKLKTDQLAEVKRLSSDPAYVADRAVAKALFGTFPYGRPELGTEESLGKIDFADLIEAKQRFVTADNATLTVTGNMNHSLGQRAARRYFGGWLKSDKVVPSTFRQPDPPQGDIINVKSPVPNTSEFRIAFRGPARGEKDYHAHRIAERILSSRFQGREGDKAFVRLDAHILPGSYTFAVSDWNLGKIKKHENTIAMPVTAGYQANIIAAPITGQEFTLARNAYISEFSKISAEQRWLDADTFKIAQVKTDVDAALAVTRDDVGRVLDSLLKRPAAYVLVFAEAAAANSESASN